TILAEGDGAASRLRDALSDEKLPKAIHDYKTAIHSLGEQRGIELRNVQHDPMLYSYLLDPTYSSHRLPDVALRRLGLKLSGNVADSADVTGRLASTLRRAAEAWGVLKAFHDVDLPFVPGAARLEDAGDNRYRRILCPRRSTPPLHVCILPSGKPELLREGSHQPVPICRTYPFVLSWAVKFAQPSPPSPDM